MSSRRRCCARHPCRRRSRGGRASRCTTTASTIGRRPDCAVFLDDVTVSRNHAVITSGPGGTRPCADLGSLNGTYVNRRRIEDPARRSEDGDELQIGKFRLTFLLRSGERAQHSSAPTTIPLAGAGGSRSRSEPSASPLLQADYPSISISKIRYLEDQELVTPRRTPGRLPPLLAPRGRAAAHHPEAAARRVPAAARHPAGARVVDHGRVSASPTQAKQLKRAQLAEPAPTRRSHDPGDPSLHHGRPPPASSPRSKALEEYGLIPGAGARRHGRFRRDRSRGRPDRRSSSRATAWSRGNLRIFRVAGRAGGRAAAAAPHGGPALAQPRPPPGNPRRARDARGPGVAHAAPHADPRPAPDRQPDP